MMKRRLLLLCENNKIKKLEFILKHFKFLIRDTTYLEVLTCAAKLNRHTTINLIVNMHDFNVTTPLYWAVVYGNIESVEILLHYNINSDSGYRFVERAMQLELDHIVSLEFLGNGTPEKFYKISKLLLQHDRIFREVVNNYNQTSAKLKKYLIKQLELKDVNELEKYMEII